MNYLRQSRLYADGLPAVGLMFLRLFVGWALVNHGQGKIANPFGWMGPSGPPAPLQALAALSEFGGGLALILGLLTPLACLGIMSTMFVAVLMHLTNKATPTYFVMPMGAPKTADAYESAAFYFVVALALFLTGPGRLALDHLVFGRNRAARTTA